MNDVIPDFGYSEVRWEETTPANLEAVEYEYRERLQGSVEAWDDLEKKGRFLFGGLVGIGTAVVGWTFANVGSIPLIYLAGLYTLAGMFAIAAVISAISLMPSQYSYRRGVTPETLNVADWCPLLFGDDKHMNRLRGVRIKEYARAIYDNENSNRRKSRHLKWSISATALAMPAAILVALSVGAAPVALIDTTHAAVVSPVLAILIGVLAARVVAGLGLLRPVGLV